MSVYDGMLPKTRKLGYIGYYPVTNKEEWEALPDLYKTMEWQPYKDSGNNHKPSAVKAVVFDVVHMEPYGISAKVSVHPSEVQKILFCSFKNSQCHLYSVCGVELADGRQMGAKWLQDSTTGAFAIVCNGQYLGVQGGFSGHIPERVKKLEDGTFKYDFKPTEGPITHYELSNPFRHIAVEKAKLEEKSSNLDTIISNAEKKANVQIAGQVDPAKETER